ncbi:MAG: hypothetical protein Q8P02_00830, partial [Candidatus Micrarchaeota archaeon]|nr:hypothetical protein [Candidatus Micrarchaeota archaeon]
MVTTVQAAPGQPNVVAAPATLSRTGYSTQASQSGNQYTYAVSVGDISEVKRIEYYSGGQKIATINDVKLEGEQIKYTLEPASAASAVSAQKGTGKTATFTYTSATALTDPKVAVYDQNGNAIFSEGFSATTPSVPASAQATDAQVPITQTANGFSITVANIPAGKAANVYTRLYAESTADGYPASPFGLNRKLLGTITSSGGTVSVSSAKLLEYLTDLFRRGSGVGQQTVQAAGQSIQQGVQNVQTVSGTGAGATATKVAVGVLSVLEGLYETGKAAVSATADVFNGLDPETFYRYYYGFEVDFVDASGTIAQTQVAHFAHKTTDLRPGAQAQP